MKRSLAVLAACAACHAPDGASSAARPVERPPIPLVKKLVLGRLEDPATGSWGAEATVVVETTLHSAPGASDAVARLAKGSVATVADGELWEWPQRVVVVSAQRGYAVGDEFFVYAAEEEGFRPVWHGGAFGPFDFVYDDEPADRAWLRFGPEGHEQWWLAIVAADGTKGWSSDPDAFSRVSDARAPARRGSARSR